MQGHHTATSHRTRSSYFEQPILNWFLNLKRFSRIHIYCTKQSFIDICSYIVHLPMRSSKYHILCLLPRSRGPVPPQKAIIRYFQASRTSRLSIAGWRISASRNTSPSSPRRVTTCQQYRGCEYLYLQYIYVNIYKVYIISTPRYGRHTADVSCNLQSSLSVFSRLL